MASQGGAGGLTKNQVLSLVYGSYLGENSATDDGAGLMLDLGINNNEVC